jgi:hypothetical protein
MMQLNSGTSGVVTESFIPNLVISKFWQIPIIYVLCLIIMSEPPSYYYSKPPTEVEGLWKDKLINDPEKGVPEIVPFLIKWKRMARNLRFSQILLGLLATFFSILTATTVTIQSFDSYSKYFAFIAAVSIGIMTAFDLGTKSNNMMDAWRLLAAAVVKFNRELCGRQVVIDAWIEGEKTIGDVTYQQTGGQISNKPRGQPTQPTGYPPPWHP